ncbi:unnamed protein product, partial [Iphiclides podalirius]
MRFTSIDAERNPAPATWTLDGCMILDRPPSCWYHRHQEDNIAKEQRRWPRKPWLVFRRWQRGQRRLGQEISQRRI